MVCVNNEGEVNPVGRQVGVVRSAQNRFDIGDIIDRYPLGYEGQHFGLNVYCVDFAHGHALGHGKCEITGARTNVRNH